MSTIDPEKLEFPKNLAPFVGYSAQTIRRMKDKGCLFHGRKTTLKWVKSHLSREAKAKALSPGPSAHPQHSTENISDEPSQ